MRWVDAFIAVSLLASAWQWGTTLAEKAAAERTIRAAARLVAGAGGARMAIPEPLRWGVDDALALGVEPVLYEPARLPPQQLGVREVAWVVADPEQAVALARFTLETKPLGTSKLLRVDLASASRAPLAPGDELTLPYGRPFHYNPLGHSLPLRPGGSVGFPFQLDGGRYTLVVEALHTGAGAVCRVHVRGAAGAGGAIELPLRGIVRQPIEIAFRIPPGRGTRPVNVELSVAERGSKGGAFLQRLALRKEPG
jgi:hypothetical protein